MAKQREQHWDPKLYDGKHSYVADLAQELIDELELQGDETVLDLGCGTGRMSQWLLERGVKVIAVDKDSYMVAAAKQRCPGLDARVRDARDLGDLECDAVLSNATLHWVLEPGRVVAELSRVVGRSGRLALEFGGAGNLAELRRAFTLATARHGVTFDTSLRWYFPSIGDYTPLLEACGFRVDKALLFPRPTTLDDGEAGLRNWMRMFLRPELEVLPADTQQAVLRRVEDLCRPRLFREGSWHLDYVRLRVRATRR